MSSLEVTPNITKKHPMFLRRSSFQRLKCSAAYQFQLAGAKFSKTSVTQLFERFILKSRTILQTAFVFLSLPAFKLLCANILWWIDILAKVIGINLVLEKNPSKSVENDKSLSIRIQSINSSKTAPIFSNTSSSQLIEPTTDETIKSIDTIESDRLSLPSVLPVNSHQSPSPFTKSKRSIKPNGCLVLCVYGSAAFVYVEFMVLVIGLNITYTPPGLIFLLFSLAFIGYIVTKVCLTKPKQNPANLPPKPTFPARFRISRSSTKKYMAFHDKTLSKIKLL